MRFKSSGLEGVKSRVALTSHIGGHAFAGNVIIYLPKTLKMAIGEVSRAKTCMGDCGGENPAGIGDQ